MHANYLFGSFLQRFGEDFGGKDLTKDPRVVLSVKTTPTWVRRRVRQ
jgi:hypothetical protein